MKRAQGLLTVVLIFAAGVALTVGVQQLTANRAAAQHQDLQRRAWLDILPVDSYDNQPLEQPLAITAQTLENSQVQGGYLATLAGQPSAVLLRSQTSGYGGTIQLLIAVSSNGKLLGVKTLKQSETPSLGGRIAENNDAWIAAFKGHSRNDPQDSAWALKKDHGQFDQIAGATVTSRAVLNAVHDALRYVDDARQSILEPPPRD
ncbi:RnfABCDGE type electron transport complex subunit G [Pseudomonas sp. CCM 7891]|uniref:Ion-translocating oxidoreductase complex subunit G n=1 Tax=Pseudomonas karstica TaxID=1055468 RepID=A0A7X2RPQ9_9PSED|nr:RnfABCDGE type electron transport complex subunit G [Pseudomonas karstica]MTD18827.1 RnfABCDGE type electron transport complex subunit G [Pseudomonas karstica]